MRFDPPARSHSHFFFFALIVATMTIHAPAANAHCIAYVSKLNSYSSAGVLAGLGVPGYSSSPYDTYVLTHWLSNGTTTDALSVWDNLSSYISPSDALALTGLGSPTSAQIRAAIRTLDDAAGITRLVGAFGPTDAPIESGAADTTATHLANVVTNDDLDGVVIDFEETNSFSSAAGVGETWLTTLTTSLRTALPNAVIAHAPQAPYFAGTSFYPAGAYLTVNANVGDLIDWYAVQFYNQGATTYDTEQTLVFTSNGWATGTALDQIIADGVPAAKLFVGKPATVSDVSGGYVDPATLYTILDNNPDSWGGGVAIWQFASDENASFAMGSTICPLTTAHQTGVADSSGHAAFRLLGASPNPFSPATTIRFVLPQDSNVRLVVYDLMGRIVSDLVDGPLRAGTHAVPFMAPDLPGGVYYYELRVGQVREARRIVLLR